jgi:hypothetical protein
MVQKHREKEIEKIKYTRENLYGQTPGLKEIVNGRLFQQKISQFLNYTKLFPSTDGSFPWIADRIFKSLSSKAATASSMIWAIVTDLQDNCGSITVIDK